MEKTKIVDMTGGKDGFDFLGFHHRRVMSFKYKRMYAQHWPKKAAVAKFMRKIKEKIGTRAVLPFPLEDTVKLINPLIRGWMNYFKFGNSNKVFKKLDGYIHLRLALWWSKKHHKASIRWKTDFTYEKYKNSGVQVMTGNVKYWTKL